MIQLQPAQCHSVRHWFQPEAPGLGLAAPHVLATGRGAWYADRWPDPRLLMAVAGSNIVLRGDPAAFPVDDPPALVGFVDAGAEFLPVLEQAYGQVGIWPRVLFRLERLVLPAVSPDAVVRPLTASDAVHLARLAPDTAWIADTWGGPDGLAGSGFGWGVFVDGTLASVACSFFVGSNLEELGVATESAYRGRGYSTACTAALCREVLARGATPAWSTSPDNLASIRVAEKLGFRFEGDTVAYVINREAPDPA